MARDPSGGAGIRADLMTIPSPGCHELSVITALTVQDRIGIERVLSIDAGWVEAPDYTGHTRAAGFWLGMGQFIPDCFSGAKRTGAERGGAA